MSEERSRETTEPPKDTWRPPAADAPLVTQEVDVSTRPKQILIAGIGNTWQRDDGFGARSRGAWRGASCPTASR